MEMTGATVEDLCFLHGPCRGVISRQGLELSQFRSRGQCKGTHRKYKRLKLGSGQAHGRSSG
jgi:hypothetical protein